ncbi:hypothetical protein F5B18DRAFT_580150 [Nemania serpens]|nr:hypothetical protein F5B18DRAFT_580150 [Nemania serpens]
MNTLAPEWHATQKLLAADGASTIISVADGCRRSVVTKLCLYGFQGESTKTQRKHHQPVLKKGNLPLVYVYGQLTGIRGGNGSTTPGHANPNPNLQGFPSDFHTSRLAIITITHDNIVIRKSSPFMSLLFFFLRFLFFNFFVCFFFPSQEVLWSTRTSSHWQRGYCDVEVESGTRYRRVS